MNKYFLTEEIKENNELIKSRFILAEGEKLSNSFFILYLSQLQSNSLVTRKHLSILEEPTTQKEYQRYLEAFILDCERSAEEIEEALTILANDEVLYNFLEQDIVINKIPYSLDEIINAKYASKNKEIETFFKNKLIKNLNKKRKKILIIWN